MNLKPWLLHCFSALLLLVFAGFTDARSKTGPNVVEPNHALERWIEQQVARDQDANASTAFPDSSKRVIRSDFLQSLLLKPPKRKIGPQTLVLISNVTVIGYLGLPYMQIPYDLSLEECHFLGGVSFYESNFDGSLSLAGSTFDEYVNFQGMEIAGSLNASNCHFNGIGDQQVNFEYAKIGRDLTIEGAEFQGDVSFLRSHVTQIFAAENAKFGNRGKNQLAKFEDIKIGGALQIRGSQVDCAVTFLSANTGVLEAQGTHFRNAAYFTKLRVNGDAIFDGAHFDQPVNFYDMNISGNVVLENAYFATGFSLARTNIGGNLVLIGVRAPSSQFKDLSVVKIDNLIFRDNSIAPPYSLNGMSYRLLFAPQEEVLSFVNRADYDFVNSDAHKNLESFYLQRGNLERAQAVHIAWKTRERSALGTCTFCLNGNSRFFNHPSFYLWNWIQYITTHYGQHLWMLLFWSVPFIVAGFLVFRKRDWMKPTNPEANKALHLKYSPWWYSIALFLPVVSLRDKDDWIPKPGRWKSRFYMRVHMIIGYLLIPIGLASLIGLIK